MRGGISICLGILLRNHFEAIFTLIFCRQLPENLVDQDEKSKALSIVSIIGLLLILIGCAIILAGLFTWIASFTVQNNNFNFKL